MVVAFDGLSKLFEQSKIIESDPLEKIGYQHMSHNVDHQVKDHTSSSVKKKSEKLTKYSFDTRNDNKINKKNKSNHKNNSQNEIGSTGRIESFDKRSKSSGPLKGRLSEDGRQNKSSTLNEMQLYPIRKMDHSLKDARIENSNKTPVLSK